jgi:hypothetical protein
VSHNTKGKQLSNHLLKGTPCISETIEPSAMKPDVIYTVTRGNGAFRRGDRIYTCSKFGFVVLVGVGCLENEGIAESMKGVKLQQENRCQ